MPHKDDNLKGRIAIAAAPLLDVVLFCVFLANGAPLLISHIASFALAMALNYLLKIRPMIAAAGRGRDVSLHCRLLLVTVMALFLRGGVLALLSQTWHWPPQAAIVLAIIAGLAVTASGYSYALSPAAGEARTRALAIGLIGYAFALRLVYSGSVELLPEETYYWNYARHLDIGYLDHPPLVAWLISLGTGVFGQSQFGVRVGALCCGVIASIFAYRLARNLFDDAAALAALLLAHTLPFFFLSGLLMTPDAGLTAAWAASLYYLERALLAGRATAWWGAGAALGLGMISKYSIGLLVPVIILFMLLDRQSRRWWTRWEPYAAAALALAIFSPVILWNAQHDWASFAFQTSRRLAEAPRFALHRLLASALVLITPIGVLAVAAYFTGARPASADAARRRLFTAAAVLMPLAVFALFSLRHDVKLDWTGAPWTAALPLMAAGMGVAGAGVAGVRAWLRQAWPPTLVCMLLLYGAGLHYLVLGLPGAGYSKHIELIPVGWRDFSRRIAAAAAVVRTETGAEPLIVGMDRYAIASELAFYGGGAQPALQTSSSHLFGGMGLMYERWTPAEQQQGRNLLLVAWDARELADSAVASHAEHLGPVSDDVLWQNGRAVRHYYYRVAYNYRNVRDIR